MGKTYRLPSSFALLGLRGVWSNLCLELGSGYRGAQRTLGILGRLCFRRDFIVFSWAGFHH